MNTATTANDANAEEALKAAAKAKRLERLHTRINKASKYLNVAGLGWVTPILKMAAGEDAKTQGKELWRLLGVPVTAIMLFLAMWAQTAPMVKTSLGAIPGPVQVWEQTVNLYADHVREREKEAAFYDRQDKRNAAKLDKNPSAEIKVRQYTGKPTYIDQIFTSLKTVFMGFMIGSLIAVPLGVFCGLSPTVNAALNPLIQVFKPVSPLAWLPLVTMVVSAVYVSDNPMFDKAFVTSAITVTLCSLWPTLINTAVGVASIDKDLMNVGRVLRLKWDTTLTKLVLPSSLPYIFTGLRLSLGVGWMVLIAAEMLAQNPGLGKFVWDEFQNGSSQSLAKIMVAVFTIGIIGFALDRIMSAMQAMFTHGEVR
ncbi:ABC transporter permease [Magnetovibrio sp.]|uniref:ABC transporter permease n=1 Tax=Magnetovibrio sp. TaxID=2024836 RepID=UPI002F955C9C